MTRASTRNVQTNVYHYCCHKQKVNIPSTNPACKNELVGFEYLMNQWCPRCRWMGFIVPFEYEELAKGIPCGGYRGKVPRKVTLRREAFRPLTKEQIWAGRENFLRDDMGAFYKAQQVENYNTARDREHAQKVSDLDRTYFMEKPDDEDRSYNLCPELFRPLQPHDIPEFETECSFCKVPWFYEYGEGRYLSHDAVMLPCGHIFGRACITGWMGGRRTPKCLLCTRKYNIVHEITDTEWEDWLPAEFLEQKAVDFAPDSDIHRLKMSLIYLYQAKMLLIAILFTPPPFISWVNIFAMTLGAIWFYSSFIHLPTGAPSFSPREQVIQNRLALFSAICNTIELLIARFIGAGRWSLLAYPCFSWLALELLRQILTDMGRGSHFQLSLPEIRLPSPFERSYVVLEPLE